MLRCSWGLESLQLSSVSLVPLCERLADAHGTRGFGVSPSGVCGQGPSVGMTLPGPLGGGLKVYRRPLAGYNLLNGRELGLVGPTRLRGVDQ